MEKFESVESELLTTPFLSIVKMRLSGINTYAINPLQDPINGTVLLLTVRYAFSSFVLFPNPAMKGAEDSGNKLAIPERQSILNSSGFLVQTSRNNAEIKDDGFNKIGP